MNKRPSLRHYGVFLALVLFLSSASEQLFAASAMWTLNPANGDWHDSVDWSPATVPDGPAHISTFGVSNLTNVFLSGADIFIAGFGWPKATEVPGNASESDSGGLQLITPATQSDLTLPARISAFASKLTDSAKESQGHAESPAGSDPFNTPTFLEARSAPIPNATINGTGWKGTVNNGTTNTANWSNPANWDSTPPASDERNLLFGQAYTAAGGTNFIANNDLSNYTGYRITFESVANPVSFTLTGNALTLADFSGGVAKIENYSSVNQTLNFSGLGFGGSLGWAEINAINGPLTFGSSSTLVFSGAVAGIKLFGSGQSVTFNNTINASGKWFALTGNPANAVNINGSATTGDFYVMNAGILNLNSGGSLTTSAVRLGGDFGITGNQDQTKGGTFALTNSTGGQSFSGTINTVAGNTSGQLAISSRNNSGVNTISSQIFLDSDLRIGTSGGALRFQDGSFDIKNRTLTVINGGPVTINEPLTSSSASGGTLFLRGGNLTLQNINNTYTGTNSAALNPNGTQIIQGILGLYGDGSLGLVPQTAYNNIQISTFASLRAFADLNLHANRNILFSGTLDLRSNGYTFTINGIISESANFSAVRCFGPGTVKLANPANAYSDYTLINNDVTLEVTKLANAGSNSSLGRSPADPIYLQIYGTLKYTGTGDSTNRNFRIAGASALDSSGTGPLNFTNTTDVQALGDVVFTLTGSNTGANTLRAGIPNGIAETPPITSIVKDGAGSWVLSGTSTYSGTTTVNNGTLTVQNGSGSVGKLSETSAITVRNGSTLVLAGDSAVSDRLKNNAGLTLTNATLRLNGVPEGNTTTPGLGGLTLASNTNSVLDLVGTTLLHFAASGNLPWTGTLSIWNWSGSFGGGGSEQLLFGTDDTAASLTETQRDMINFYSDGGITFLGTARFAGLNNGEILPVPEPATWLTLSSSLCGLWMARRARARRTQLRQMAKLPSGTN